MQLKSILQKLYDGEIAPCEQIHLRSGAYRDMKSALYQRHKDFAEKLEAISPELKKEFIEIQEEQMNPFSLELSENFIEGFRLGARLMAEVYQTAYADCPE